jgi:hypothetical protein
MMQLYLTFRFRVKVTFRLSTPTLGLVFRGWGISFVCAFAVLGLACRLEV